MTAGKYDFIIIEQGTTFRKIFCWQQSNGDPVDLTGATAKRLAVARGRWNSEPLAAEHFGVSDALLTWRLNMAGVRRRVAGARAATDSRRSRQRPA